MMEDVTPLTNRIKAPAHQCSRSSCGPVTLFGQTIEWPDSSGEAQGWQLLFDGKTLKGWHPGLLSRGGGPGGAGAPAVAPRALAQIGSTPKPCVTGVKDLRPLRPAVLIGRS